MPTCACVVCSGVFQLTPFPRRWLLPRLLTSDESRTQLKDSEVESWLRTDIALCTSVSEAYPKNYYSWTHRQWVIETFGRHIAHTTAWRELLDSEVTFARDWIEKHLSDYCGYHHLLFLLEQVSHLEPLHQAFSKELIIGLKADFAPQYIARAGKAQSCGTCALYNTQWLKLREQIQKYPGHEAMWCCFRVLTLARERLALDHGQTLCIAAPLALTDSSNRLRFQQYLAWLQRKGSALCAKDIALEFTSSAKSSWV